MLDHPSSLAAQRRSVSSGYKVDRDVVIPCSAVDDSPQLGHSAVTPSPWLALRPLWDCAPGAWFVYAGDGRLVYANAALEQLVGCKPTLGSRAPVPPVLPQSRLAYTRLIERLRSERWVNGVTQLTLPIDAAGRCRFLNARLIAVPDPTGEGNAIVGMCYEQEPGERFEGDAAVQRVSELEDGLARIASEIAALHECEDGLAHQIPGLSPRQEQILACLIDGQRPAVIARTLHLSIHTVRNHTKAILRKADVHSQAELIKRVRSADGLSRES